MNANSTEDLIQRSKKKENVCHRITSCIWSTPDTVEDTNDKRKYLKSSFREFIAYLVFLALAVLVTLGHTNSLSYFYTHALENLFLNAKLDPENGETTFLDSTTTSQMWEFLEGPLMKGLYWEHKWYNQPDVVNSSSIFYDVKLVGVPRLRQVRVRNSSCTIAPDVKSIIHDCYAPMSRDHIETRPFGPNNSTAWRFRSANEMDSERYWGSLTYYEGGGYSIDLGLNLSTSEEIISELKHLQWVDRQTRAVFIDFTTYNGNINLFCVIKLIFEFPASGGMFVNNDFRTLKLFRYVRPFDIFLLVCEIFYLLYIIYYITEEIVEIKMKKLSYFKEFWNWIDVIIILLSVVCVGFNIFRTVKINEKIENLAVNKYLYSDFEFLAYWQMMFDRFSTVAIFLIWAKVLKLVRFNSNLTQLGATLMKGFQDLMGFMIMYCIVFFGFSVIAFILFGARVHGFRDYIHTLTSMMMMVLGESELDDMMRAQPILAPLFYFSYILFMFFVLLNIFVSILSDAYSVVKVEVDAKTGQYGMTDFIKEKKDKIVKKLNPKEKRLNEIEIALKTADENKDHKVQFDEWRNVMKSYGYSEAEIQFIFDKYDRNGDQTLDEEEQQMMLDDIVLKKKKIVEESESEQQLEEKAPIPIPGDNITVTTEMIKALKERTAALKDQGLLLKERMENVFDILERLNACQSEDKISSSTVIV